jgi:hypothetical protein
LTVSVVSVVVVPPGPVCFVVVVEDDFSAQPSVRVAPNKTIAAHEIKRFIVRTPVVVASKFPGGARTASSQALADGGEANRLGGYAFAVPKGVETAGTSCWASLGAVSPQMVSQELSQRMIAGQEEPARKNRPGRTGQGEALNGRATPQTPLARTDA